MLHLHSIASINPNWIQKTRKILLLAHQPTFLLLIDFSYYFCFQFSNCSSQSFYNEWWSTSSCRLHTGIILDFNSHRTIISNFNKSFMLKTRQSHSKITLHWKSKQGNKAESIMQTTQFSAKIFYGKRHCIKESRNWWNEKEAKHKENYYFNFNFMNCLRARWVLFPFHFSTMADAQEQYSEFLDFEDFIAIIIEEMLIYRQYFGQFQTSNQMHYTVSLRRVRHSADQKTYHNTQKKNVTKSIFRVHAMCIFESNEQNQRKKH